MNNKIIIEVKNNINRVINKCINNKLYLSDINYIDKDLIRCKIDLSEYKRFKRLNYYSKIKIIGYSGINKLKYSIKNNIVFFLISLFMFIMMDILTSYIVKIEVIHSSNTIRNLVYKELENNGVKPYKLSLSYEEINNLQKKILDNNHDKLEWISIKKDGMKYIVNVEERKINIPVKEEGYRHVISKKDAYITKIISSRGENLVRSGDYVKKGDILISGNIKLYEEVKGNTLATGTVYGDVWYNVTISVPKKKTTKKYTGEERYNLNINNKIFLKNKYSYFEQINIREINILGVKIKLYKEKEYKNITNNIDSKRADVIVNNELKNKFKSIGNIVNQKVLKKDINNSTIDYRIFVVCNELISDYKYYEEELK